MIVIGLISWVLGIGLLCWVFFSLVSIVMPTMAGLIVFFWTYRMGAGLVAALPSIIAGSLVLWLFRIALTTARRPEIKLAVVLAFCFPASVAGYFATTGLAEIGISSPLMRIILGVLGAAVVGAASFARLAPDADLVTGTFPSRRN
ncbi:hypothetical protein [Asaia sp. As-1742]|uniref:hypothetical protein n=1 Tax=Asaia sp. As-1742 TaxID=2608325 RepID=UPI0014232514|nr:hypothetical protein [Asaia sp. As-1742]NIE81721.1 hypothetical protein [Asaia sp. As-1742]